jgi:gamma-glutamylcysteine synthetase
MTKRQLSRAAHAINRCRNTLVEIANELTPAQLKQIGAEERGGLNTTTDALYQALERLDIILAGKATL